MKCPFCCDEHELDFELRRLVVRIEELGAAGPHPVNAYIVAVASVRLARRMVGRRQPEVDFYLTNLERAGRLATSLHEPVEHSLWTLADLLVW